MRQKSEFYARHFVMTCNEAIHYFGNNSAPIYYMLIYFWVRRLPGKTWSAVHVVYYIDTSLARVARSPQAAVVGRAGASKVQMLSDVRHQDFY